MSQHLSKDELQSDALLSIYGQSAVYYSQNRTKVLGIVAAIVVLIIAVIGYTLYMNRQENRGQAMLGKAERFITDRQWAMGLTGNDVEGIASFPAIADNYAGTDAGNMAAYYAAVCAFNENDNEKALVYIRKHNPPNDVIGIGATSLHAVIEANAGNHKQAAELYVKAAEIVKSDVNTPQHLLLAAQQYVAASMKPDAQKMLARIVSDYPDSPSANDARKLSGMLN